MWAIITLRPYLKGVRFSLRTDHGPLQWIMNLADASGRLARWRLRLLEYEFDIQYNPGREHHLADAMSRLPTGGGDVAEIEDEIPCFAVVEDPEEESTDSDYHLLCTSGEVANLDGTPWNPEVFALLQEQTDVTTIPVEEFLREQASDPYCKRVAEIIGIPGSQFEYNHQGYLLRKSPLDGTLQKFVPLALRPRVLSIALPSILGSPWWY